MKRPLVLGSFLLLSISAILLWHFTRPTALRVAKSDLCRVDGVWQNQLGQPFTGILFDTDKNGLTTEEIPLTNGKAHGLAKGWHPNGQLEIEEPFVEGKSHGQRTRYHPNGQIRSIAQITQGVLQGTFLEYHDNGQLAAKMTMVDGQAEGRAQAWHPDGSFKAEVTLHRGEPVVDAAPQTNNP